MGLFFHERAGPVIYMRLPCQWRALRVSPAQYLVDDLPPAFNFGPKHNFSIYISRFLDSGKFILAIIIFPGKIMQKIFGTTYQITRKAYPAYDYKKYDTAAG